VSQGLYAHERARRSVEKLTAPRVIATPQVPVNRYAAAGRNLQTSFPPKLGTQTSPSASPRTNGVLPVGIVSTIVFVAGSIRAI
jgi:hypothetical protein